MSVATAAEAVGADAAAPSFERDVMAVLSRVGCNAGTCHGNQQGKGGFKLSLRGADPADDHRAITRGAAGRRVDRLQPAESLLLLKPTHRVPHGGGRKLSVDSAEYRILRDWIAGGAGGPAADAPRLVRLEVMPRDEVLFAPRDRVLLQATAHFDDDSQRDVTHLSTFEPISTQLQITPEGEVICGEPGEHLLLVRYLERQVPVRLALVPQRDVLTDERPTGEGLIDEGPTGDAQRAAGFIDRHIDDRLRALRLQPAPTCDDRTFARRVYLDLTGLPPTADEARRFADDARPDKRDRLVEELLDRPEFAQQWALKWSDLLRNDAKLLDAKGVQVFHDWLQRSFAENKPLDRLARELIRSRGSTYKVAAANYWRAQREPRLRAETTARVFLGYRLLCARCHNHPYDKWTQDEYYGWTALFAGIDYKIVENKRKDKHDKHEFRGEQIVEVAAQVAEKDRVKHARSGAVAEPRFLGAEFEQHQDDRDRLEALARWLTAPGNRQFARAQANRVWYHLLGRGLVEPVDDFRVTNPASHPALLEVLTDRLIESGYDMRQLIRAIVASQTYQRAAVGAAEGDAPQTYATTAIRRLAAEQLLDAQCRLLDVSAKFRGAPAGTRAGGLAGVAPAKVAEEGDRFLALFGKPRRLISSECERSCETSLSQALVLVGGEGLQARLTAKENRLARLAASERSDREVVDELYWEALGRDASDAEWQAVERLLNEHDRRAALEDIAWALVNAKEFLFRY